MAFAVLCGIAALAEHEPSPESKQLVAYLNAYPEGLVLRYDKAGNYQDVDKDWSGSGVKGLDGLTWNLSRDTGNEFKLVLRVQGGKLTLNHASGNAEETEVYLGLYKEYGENDVNIERVFILKTTGGDPVKAPWKKDSNPDFSVLAYVYKADDGKPYDIDQSLVIVNITESWLFEYGDYEKAAADVNQKTEDTVDKDDSTTAGGANDEEESDDEDDPGDSEQPELSLTDDDIITNFLNDVIERTDLSKNDEIGKVVLGVEYDKNAGKWILSNDADPEAFQGNYEMVATGGGSSMVFGLILLMIVCACSLGLSVYIIVMKARK